MTHLNNIIITEEDEEREAEELVDDIAKRNQS